MSEIVLIKKKINNGHNNQDKIFKLVQLLKMVFAAKGRIQFSEFFSNIVIFINLFCSFFFQSFSNSKSSWWTVHHVHLPSKKKKISSFININIFGTYLKIFIIKY